MNLEKKIRKYVGKAIADYSLIEAKDRLLVGLSGGKDSWTILAILSQLQKIAPISFEIQAIHVRPDKNNIVLADMKEYCEKLNIKLTILPTNIKEIIEENNFFIKEIKETAEKREETWIIVQPSA